MRRLTLLFSLLFIVSLSCKKDNNNTPPPPPPPPGGGGGTGTVTITSVSPQAPYGGDTITIKGTGFSTDKTKDTLAYGIVNNGTFNFTGFSGPLHIKIVSATATEIKIVTDSALPISVNNVGLNYALTVHAPNGVAFTGNTLQFKLPFRLEAFTPSGPYILNCPSIFTDDSLFLQGEGLFPPLTFTINGKALPLISDNNFGQSARTHIPIDFYGHLDPPYGCPGSKYYEYKVVNGDGKVVTGSQFFYEGPASTFSYTLDASSYHLSTKTQAIMHLTGYAIRDDINIVISTLDNSDQSTSFKVISAGVGTDFPSAKDITIDLLALPTPKSSLGLAVTINLQIGPTKPANGYGFGGGFTVFN